MALRAGYYGIKKALNEKLKNLPGFSAIGTGLQINSDGELEATGATMTIDPNPEGSATESLEKLQIGETIYGVNDNTKCYQTDDSTESAIVDADYVPFYDASASAPKKSTWSNFCNKIQAKLTAFVDWLSYAKTGVHNLNGTKYVTDTYFTANSDGSVTVNVATGQAGNITDGLDGSSGFIAPFDAQVKLTGGLSNDFHVFAYDMTASARPYTDSSKTTRIDSSNNQYGGTPQSFYMEKGHKYAMIIRVMAGTVVSDQTIYPLLTLQEDTNTDFSSPAMTNRELTDEIAVKKNTITLGQNVTSDANSVTKQGKVVDFYLHVTTMPDTSSGDVVLGTIPYLPVDANVFFTIRSNSSPYAPIASGFIRQSTGELAIKPGAMDGQTACYVSGTYICQ